LYARESINALKSELEKTFLAEVLQYLGLTVTVTQLNMKRDEMQAPGMSLPPMILVCCFHLLFDSIRLSVDSANDKVLGLVSSLRLAIQAMYLKELLWSILCQA
jgi:hypothetical protein